MNKKQLIIIYLLVFIAGLFCFYQFMTYDRNYTWAKEYKEVVFMIARKDGFMIGQTSPIEVDGIKRSSEKKIKIKIQKILSKVHLMYYGHEFGESTELRPEKNSGFLNCKGWFLDDYLIGLEIEYRNIDVETLKKIKNDFEIQFDNYKIIWTQLETK